MCDSLWILFNIFCSHGNVLITVRTCASRKEIVSRRKYTEKTTDSRKQRKRRTINPLIVPCASAGQGGAERDTCDRRGTRTGEGGGEGKRDHGIVCEMRERVAATIESVEGVNEIDGRPVVAELSFESASAVTRSSSRPSGRPALKTSHYNQVECNLVNGIKAPISMASRTLARECDNERDNVVATRHVHRRDT